ncbi:hypothetical protein [Flavobacterium psychrotrophum]|uniref:hypothetical protein n=1 Tax=Flavobacterium psychrotrophum TaxID=2294119 RepID=UPI000E30B47B|nr:hypothetical protein [Flavobacterium psychrotrophum]
MSYTEIFKFNKDGEAECFAEIKNSHRGAMAIWNRMDVKYLPPLPQPGWLPFGGRLYRMADFLNKNSHQEIWDLFRDPNVSEVDRIVLGSTFDNVVVYSHDFTRLISAFKAFDGETSLKDQADAIMKLIETEKDIIAIAWNQTSVNDDIWISPDPDDRDEDENRRPYNILKHTGHWDLFEI